jgi:hypothetical protein
MNKTRLFASLSLGALAAATLIALSATPSSAFTLSTTSVTPSFSAGNIDQVWWHHHHCWWGRYHHRHCHWW